jgi:hypothetical protein
MNPLALYLTVTLIGRHVPIGTFMVMDWFCKTDVLARSLPRGAQARGCARGLLETPGWRSKRAQWSGFDFRYSPNHKLNSECQILNCTGIGYLLMERNSNIRKMSARTRSEY